MHLITAAVATVLAFSSTGSATPLESAMSETETVVMGMTDREWDFTVNTVTQDATLNPLYEAEITVYPHGGGDIRIQPYVLEAIHRRDAGGLVVLAHEYNHALNWCATEGEVEAAAFTMANVIAKRLGWRDRVTYTEWRAQNAEPEAFDIVATHTGWERIQRMETSEEACS